MDAVNRASGVWDGLGGEPLLAHELPDVPDGGDQAATDLEEQRTLERWCTQLALR